MVDQQSITRLDQTALLEGIPPSELTWKVTAEGLVLEDRFQVILVAEEAEDLSLLVVMRQAQLLVLLEALAVRLAVVEPLAEIQPWMVLVLVQVEALTEQPETVAVLPRVVEAEAGQVVVSRLVAVDSTEVRRVRPCAAITNSSQEALRQQPAIPVQAQQQVPSLITSVAPVAGQEQRELVAQAEQVALMVVEAGAAVLLSAATVALVALVVLGLRESPRFSETYAEILTG